MKKSLFVVREKMPETNSSSDHVVIISSKELGKDSSIWQGIDPSGKNIIPDGANFDWDYFKSNEVYTKIQYACALSCNYLNSLEAYEDSSKKDLERIKSVFHEFCGGELVFKWQDRLDKKIDDLRKKGLDDDKINIELNENNYFPDFSVDHQSSDKYYEVFESDETLKNFIFSPYSWVFGGNDNSEAEPGYYNTYNIKLENDPNKIDAVLSVDFGGQIGRIDFNIQNFPCSDISYEISNLESNDILFDYIESLKYDIYKKKFEKRTKEGDSYLSIFKYLYRNFLFSTYGTWFVIYAKKPIIEELTKKFRQSEDFCSDVLKELSKKYKKEMDYIILPAKIRTNEFGEL